MWLLCGFYVGCSPVQDIWAGFLAGWPSLPGNQNHEPRAQSTFDLSSALERAQKSSKRPKSSKISMFFIVFSKVFQRFHTKLRTSELF